MKSITIRDGVMLHHIEDIKFKTTTLGVYVHRPLCAQDASKNALLPMVLRRGSERYPTFTDIERRLCDLCGAVLDTGVTKKGEDEILCFNISTISDQYYTGEDNILFSCADLLFDLLLHPKTEHGVFTEAYVGSEKENLCDMIDALVNDKQSYALWRLYEVMCADERTAYMSMVRARLRSRLRLRSCGATIKRCSKRAGLIFLYAAARTLTPLRKRHGRLLRRLKRAAQRTRRRSPGTPRG